MVDVVEVLTDSINPRDYWFKMKLRVKSEDGLELSTICRQLKLEAPDGKQRETDCANIEGIFRIVQSIPSPKVEPFKRWLAKVGYERIREIEDPELAQERMKKLYKQTAEISKATFGMTPSQYKKYKGLPDKSHQNLRDNMNDFELIFTMLVEKVTTEISQKEKPKIMPQHKEVAKKGGSVAGLARAETEKQIGRSVVTKRLS